MELEITSDATESASSGYPLLPHSATLFRSYTCAYNDNTKIVGLALAVVFTILLAVTFIRAYYTLSQTHTKRVYGIAAFVWLHFAIICILADFLSGE